jgi:hypothetical protein
VKGYCKMAQNDKKVVIADSISDLDEKQRKSLSEYHIFLKEIEAGIDQLNNLRDDLNTMVGELSVFFHVKLDDERETVIKATDIRAPKDEGICKAFIEKYGFIDRIKIL